MPVRATKINHEKKHLVVRSCCLTIQKNDGLKYIIREIIKWRRLLVILTLKTQPSRTIRIVDR